MKKPIRSRIKNIGNKKTGSKCILELDGQSIEVERKKIKNLYLKVRPPEGRLYVSAPLRMPLEAIRDFIASKEDWIRLQQEKLRRRQSSVPLREARYLTGEEIFYWGRTLPLEVRYGQKRNEVCHADTHILLLVRKQETDSKAEERYSILKQFYRDELNQKLPDLIEKWEAIIGVKAKAWTLRDMTSRWGTCNVRQKKICLNLKLAGKAPECLEYVLVHELVHLLESSHNRIFKSYMDQYLPAWRSIKARLNG